MRSRAAAGLALACVAASALGGEAAEPAPIERLVPANALALVQATDTARLRAAFEQSALSEAIQASHVLRYLRAAAGAAFEFGSTLLSGLPADELRACLGPRAGIVLLDVKDVADLRQRVPVVLLLEAADAKKLEATLLAQFDVLSLLNEKLALARREHLGVAVHELRLPNGGFLAFAFCQEVLVVGGREGVNALLSSQVGAAPRLATTPSYQAVRQGLGKPGAALFAYVNLRALLQRLAPGADPAQIKPLQVIGIANAQAAGLALDFSGRQLRERLFVALEGPPTGVLRLLTEGEPVAFTADKFVPRGYSLVLSVALRDVGLWDRLRSLVDQTRGPVGVDWLETVARHVEQEFGFHPKGGIADTLSDELFAALDLSQFRSFHGSGRQPKAQELPLLVGARLRDAAALKATADRLAANQKLWEKGVQRTTIEHEGVAISAFRTPLNPEVRPSHVIVDDTLLFSLRPEPLTAALTARKGAKTFAGPGPAPKAHVCLQVNDAQLLAAILAAIRDELPQPAKRLLPEADKILGGLHGYRAALRRTPEGIAVEAQSDIGTVGTLAAALLMLDQGKAIIARRVSADFDQIGTALEACRAKKGQYPETLDQLVPDFLPHLGSDRFVPAFPYRYSRGRPGADGALPDAWILVSLGPDHRPDIPIEQFDPPAWAAALQSQDPAEIERLKRVLYRFRPEQCPDERKNDDEGDLFRMGGRGLAPRTAPAEKPKEPGATKREDF
ncbi:MAG TPA: hypothetical protein VNE39_13660 [Planctomycetota bacterium]|nr:hypothetical protein [Planctomycetota bacterium]